MLPRVFFIVLVSSLSINIGVVCQEKYDHLPDSLVKGIYKSYHDLAENAPFYTDTFSILHANDARSGNFMFLEWEFYYNVDNDRVVYEPKGKFKVKDASSFFGYSDGNKIYISFKQFHPLTIFGPISLIKVLEKRPKGDSGIVFPFGGLLSYGIEAAINSGEYGTVDDWFVVDLYSGTIDPIHPIYLNPIFRKHDKELYQEFRKNKQCNKLETMIDFVVRFNERNSMPK